MIPASVNCFQQLTSREKIEVLFEILTKGIPNSTVVGELDADTVVAATIIPITAKAWSLSVVGSNSPAIIINGVSQTIVSGSVLSGIGPLIHPITATTPTGTVITYSYSQ